MFAREVENLRRTILTHGRLDELLDAALREDLDRAGDVTTDAFVDGVATGRGVIRAREAGVACGWSLLEALPGFTDQWFDDARTETVDGDRLEPGAIIARLAGPRRKLLTIERTMLNIIGWLSGVATAAAAYVDAVQGTGARICATRKTTPSVRVFEKYAVACGGADPHRFGLFDAMLVKDNHLAGAPLDELPSRLDAAARKARAEHRLSFVEVEVDTLEQLDRVLTCRPETIDIILLDNMSPDDLRAAVARRDAERPAWRLEASGGVTLETVRAVAETGVDRISVGAITHSAPSLDVGLDLE